MKLKSSEIADKLLLCVGNNQVEVVVTNNSLAAKSHVFATDGLFVIIFNEAKINNEKELDDVIKLTRDRINGIIPPPSTTHKVIEKDVTTAQINKVGEKMIKPRAQRHTIGTGKRGRPVGSRNSR